MYNSLVRRRNQVDNAWSQIDVQLKRRHDLIPNLVEAVKDYMSYEQETLTNVTKARAAAIDAGNQGPQAQAQAENVLTGTPQVAVRRRRELPGPQGQPERHAAFRKSSPRRRTRSPSRGSSTTTACSPTTTRSRCSRPTSSPGMFNFTTRQFFEAPEADRAVPKVDLR